jgi:hypothetical protein
MVELAYAFCQHRRLVFGVSFVDAGCAFPANGTLDYIQIRFNPQVGNVGTTHPPPTNHPKTHNSQTIVLKNWMVIIYH